MIALHTLGLEDVGQFVVDGIHIALGQLVVAIETYTDRASRSAALHINRPDIGNAAQIGSRQTKCFDRTLCLGFVVNGAE